MKAPRSAVVFGLWSLAAAGCHVGMRSGAFEPALGPRGVVVELTGSGGQQVAGELLEVQGDGIVVLSGVTRGEVVARAGRKLLFVPFAAVAHAAFHQLKITIGGQVPPDVQQRERLRLLSRFPKGLPAEALPTLLAACEQAEIEVLKP